METIYFCFVVFIFALAIFDLMVGVSNDAVNFLNSAVGAKAARFKVILAVAAAGIFLGAITSNGMMDIARHGIFHPEMFSINELMCIFLAVMVTDVILLDIFNSLGLPTSTTVSMVFELLGGTCVLALLKMVVDDTGTLGFDDLLNTEKALSVIMGIFCSVAIAFIFGTVVQWIARIIFTFNYTKRLKWTIGIFGGVACTAIAYFIVVKGFKTASFMTEEVTQWISTYTPHMLLICLVVFTLLMQLLHILKVNVFKIIILMGTFALAMAFAGNDLVNFIGVPLAGYSSYTDYAANGAGNPDTFLMSSLNGPAQTPFIFLFIAGCIMMYSLATSKKAKNVIKTSLDLSRQDEGEEMFGSSRAARSIVRSFTATSEWITRHMPTSVKEWINSRFRKDEIIMEQGATFDLVRATVNIVLASALIIMGTSLKLPLSTTYVTFIVAMGTSLADRAWSRESAVFRVTGILSVIGGWFITAGAAFTFCAIITILMYYGGTVVIVLFVILTIFILFKSSKLIRKNDTRTKEDEIFDRLTHCEDKNERWSILREHVQATQLHILDLAWQTYNNIIDGTSNEQLNKLRRATKQIDELKEYRKRSRRRELIGMRSIDRVLSLEKNTWFHLALNNTEQMIYCLKRMAEPCYEHVDNNFTALTTAQTDELKKLKEEVDGFIARSRNIVEKNNFNDVDALREEEEIYKNKISKLRKEHIDLMHDENVNLNSSLIYLNLLKETQELIGSMRHASRAYRNFCE